MNNNNRDITERWDEDILKFMEKAKKEKELEESNKVATHIERYGSIGSDMINMSRSIKERKARDGDDFLLKDITNEIDNDPHFIKSKRILEREQEREAEDEAYWEEFHRKLEAERKTNESIRKSFSEETYQQYLETERQKKIKKARQRYSSY